MDRLSYAIVLFVQFFILSFIPFLLFFFLPLVVRWSCSRASRLHRNHYSVPKYVLRRRMCNNETDGALMDARAHRREASEDGQTWKERKGSGACAFSARAPGTERNGSERNLTCFLFDTFSGPSFLLRATRRDVPPFPINRTRKLSSLRLINNNSYDPSVSYMCLCFFSFGYFSIARVNDFYIIFFRIVYNKNEIACLLRQRLSLAVDEWSHGCRFEYQLAAANSPENRGVKRENGHTFIRRGRDLGVMRRPVCVKPRR